MLKIVSLEISSWRGISIGAVHYYGKLICYPGDYSEVEILRTLDEDAAFKLTKQKNNNKNPNFFVEYTKGMKVKEFDNPGEIKEIALKIWKKHFPDAVILQEGRSGIAMPQITLAADDKDLMKQINEWANRIEELGGYDRDNGDEVDKICDEYWKIVTEEK